MPPSLEACYQKLSGIIGSGMEPIDVIQRLEEHRRYWRPDSTTVILLAESHVYTSGDDLLRTIRRLPFLPADLPRGFVRLVYCLAYGEDQLLDQPAETSRNGGTPQFWKIFVSCLQPVSQNVDFAAVQVTRSGFNDRIANKVEVLTRVKASGVWLVDASIAALYLPGRPKPPAGTIAAAIHASWDGYIRSVVEEAAPQAIVCVGLGVARTLRSRLNNLAVPWAAVPQPNARLSSAEHFRIFDAYNRVCIDPDRLHSICRAWDTAV